MDYKELLERFTYEDEMKIMRRIATVTANNYQENRDIINEIVLWKINRQPQIDDELIDMIYSISNIHTPMEAAENSRTIEVLKKLLNSKGMQLPMASTVLHFYYPDVYPIIDQRAYRELYGIEYLKNTIRVETLIEIYIKYIVDCFEYWQLRCPEISFSKIDKILYQIDKERGFKVKY